MKNLLSRGQMTMVLVTLAMVVATGLSAVDMSKRHRLLDGVVSGTTLADVGDMMAGIDRFENALARDPPGEDLRGRARIFDAMRTKLAAMRIGEASAAEQSPDEQAARDALNGAMLDLQLAAIDEDGPDMRARTHAILLDMQDALKALTLAATASLKRSLAADLTVTDAALRLHLALLSAAVLCGLSLLLIALRRAFVQHRLARQDALTGLMNRLSFSETLARLVADPGPGNDVGLILLDLDHFKNINDMFGHSVGDQLLRSVAARLSSLSEEAVHVARLGGDEFAIVLAARRAHGLAADKVDRIQRLLLEPVALGTRQVSVTLSIGVSVTPFGRYDAQTLMRNADIALYAAKAAGRGRARSFSARMDREFIDRRQLEDDLRRAVTDDRILAHFQPVVALASGRIVTCEALARWDRPGHGWVPPGRFIAVAEEVGLIKEIGASILRQACAAAGDWPEDVRVSVNVSARQFDEELVPTVAAALAATGLPASRLEIEITESALVRDSVSVARVLGDLRRMGVQIALDDFGTGYSSLSHLQRFAINRIKIDQSFVRAMAESPQSVAIVESICRLARTLGVATTAEGIETEDDAALLRGFRCDEGQGFLFHRPMPPADCAAAIGAETRHTRAD